MASPVQILANRANAAHSTGPRTPEGKARCASNAVRHGLTATNLLVRDDERATFEAFRADLLDELAPEGAVGTVTFNDLLHAAWNLECFRRLEAERGADLDDPESAAFLDRLARYQSRAQRAFYRALRELRVLQTNRALRALKLTEEQDAEVPVIVDINEMTKQTHSEVRAQALDMAVKMINHETNVIRLGVLPAANPGQRPGTSEKAHKEPLSNPALRL